MAESCSFIVTHKRNNGFSTGKGGDMGGGVWGWDIVGDRGQSGGVFFCLFVCMFVFAFLMLYHYKF